MSKKMKILNVFLLILIIIGLGLLFTQDRWVTPFVNYILKSQGEEPVMDDKGTKWSGKITAIQNDCEDDGICSITVDGKVVIISNGMTLAGGPNDIMGKVTEDGGAFTNNRVGKMAQVYAGKVSNGVYTIYGNKDFYIKISN